MRFVLTVALVCCISADVAGAGQAPVRVDNASEGSETCEPSMLVQTKARLGRVRTSTHTVSPTDADYVETFQATGCPNANADISWWKTQSAATVWQDMYEYCIHVKEGTGNSAHVSGCCGEGGCTPTSCTKQSSWQQAQAGTGTTTTTRAPTDADYGATFQATGCPNGNVELTLAWWKTLSASVVWEEMYQYCKMTKDGTGDHAHVFSCCGAGSCTPSACSKQSSWQQVQAGTGTITTTRAPTNADYVATFQATGCPNDNVDVSWWKTQNPSTVWLDMYSYCTSTKAGTASAAQVWSCCGDDSCTPTACTQQSSWQQTTLTTTTTIPPTDADYVATFQATGCPNPNVDVSWWKTQGPSVVWQDMYTYCSYVKAGKGNSVHWSECCGVGTCAPTACTKQSSWQHFTGTTTTTTSTLPPYDGPDADYVATFRATGCPNGNLNVAWWKTQSPATVWEDMYSYCNQTKNMDGSDTHMWVCCGDGCCTPAACTKQSSWQQAAAQTTPSPTPAPTPTPPLQFSFPCSSTVREVDPEFSCAPVAIGVPKSEKCHNRGYYGSVKANLGYTVGIKHKSGCLMLKNGYIDHAVQLPDEMLPRKPYVLTQDVSKCQRFSLWEHSRFLKVRMIQFHGIDALGRTANQGGVGQIANTVPSDAVYVLAFKKSGCPNGNIDVTWWKTQSPAKVWDDMYMTCVFVKHGFADQRKKAACCGEGSCTPASCWKQSSWTQPLGTTEGPTDVNYSFAALGSTMFAKTAANTYENGGLQLEITGDLTNADVGMCTRCDFPYRGRFCDEAIPNPTQNIDVLIVVFMQKVEYPKLKDKIERYRQDLLSFEKYSSDVLVWDMPKAWNLRPYRALRHVIKTDYVYRKIKSVFFVGEFPAAWVYHLRYDGYKTSPVTFYYGAFSRRKYFDDSDCDGNFEIPNSGGKVNGVTLDIAVGILNHGTVDEYRAYFDKVHAHRQRGGYPLDEQNQWSFDEGHWWCSHPHASLFDRHGNFCHDGSWNIGGQNRIINYNVYMGMVNSNEKKYEYYMAKAHSFHSGIGFGVREWNIWGKPFSGIGFFNLFHCYGAKYTVRNLAMMMALSTTNGLASVGCTHTGAMLGTAIFERSLGQGLSWGSAFVRWWNLHGRYNTGWHAGMVTYGDPTLRLRGGSQRPGLLQTPPDDHADEESDMSEEEVHRLEMQFRTDEQLESDHQEDDVSFEQYAELQSHLNEQTM